MGCQKVRLFLILRLFQDFPMIFRIEGIYQYFCTQTYTIFQNRFYAIKVASFFFIICTYPVIPDSLTLIDYPKSMKITSSKRWQSIYPCTDQHRPFIQHRRPNLSIKCTVRARMILSSITSRRLGRWTDLESDQTVTSSATISPQTVRGTRPTARPSLVNPKF